MYEATKCGVCSRPRSEHDRMNHEFNENGDLIPKERPGKEKPKPRSTPTVVGAVDIDLRRILFEKGIISNADFAALYDPGAGAPGDRETGEPSSSG